MNRVRDPEDSLHTQDAAVKMALESGAIIGTWNWDIETGRFAGDRGCGRAFALDFEEAGGSVPLADVAAKVHPEDWPLIEAVSQRVMAQGGITNVEFRIRQPDGTYRWLHCSGHCDFNAQARPAHFAGVLLDIDVRKRTEARLRQSEAASREASSLLHAVIEAIPALIYVKDRNGRMQTANAAVVALVGKPWDLIKGRTDAEILDNPAEGHLIMATDQRLMETGASEELEEFVGHDEIGPRIWLSHKKALRDHNGDVVGLVGTSVEITERKRAEHALAASEQRLRNVLNNLFAFVGIVDLNGHLIEANRAPVEGAGITYDDVLGRPLWECFWWSNDPTAQAVIRTSVERALAGETSRFDIDVRWRCDTRLTIDFQIAPLRNEDGEIVQLIPSAVDVTARKEAEAQRQLLILELKHRVQNLFTIATGMITMTARESLSTNAMADALTGRLTALARSHALINPAIADNTTGHDSSLRDLIATITAPYVLPNRHQIHTSGGFVGIVADAATGLALIFHELATNSAKYGALSSEDGHLDVSWTDKADTLVVVWAETGGPSVSAPPERQGFGSRLIRSTIRGQFAGTIAYDWAPTGLVVTLSIKRRRVGNAGFPALERKPHLR